MEEVRPEQPYISFRGSISTGIPATARQIRNIREFEPAQKLHSISVGTKAIAGASRIYRLIGFLWRREKWNETAELE
jgi:hypothetical protein